MTEKPEPREELKPFGVEITRQHEDLLIFETLFTDPNGKIWKAHGSCFKFDMKEAKHDA